MEKRTTVDFSKHEVIITKTDDLLVHHLKVPETYTNSIKFINTNGILAVTGDYGNWIFCREFHPSINGSVSDHYWIEKLKIASSQEPSKYSAEETTKEIEERLKEEDLSEEDKEYYKRCLENADDELDYTYCAFREKPSCMDYECVPFCKELNPWLHVIFDGFEEICRRMALEKNKEIT